MLSSLLFGLFQVPQYADHRLENLFTVCQILLRAYRSTDIACKYQSLNMSDSYSAGKFYFFVGYVKQLGQLISCGLYGNHKVLGTTT